MGTSKEIEHPGVITSIDSSKIKVNITTYSACLSCSAKGICSISDVKDKIITLIITSSITRNEVLAGLISLGALAPYYLVLYFYKEKIRNKFTFAIKKQE
jgi:sigma-E factor negative regulatory protein RseC